MTRAWWAVLAAVVTLAGGGGCVSCDTRLVRANREAGPACAVQACDRQHVYAVLVNGACPAGACSLEGLRDGLAERGFVKTYFGQAVHVPWLAYEMRAVARCDPSARFVVVGADVGAPLAAWLARHAAADGLAVDALVLLDPVMVSSSAGCPTRTVLVACGGDYSAPHTERASVPGATPLTLPGHAGTVDLVAGLLAESASRVEQPTVVFDTVVDPDGRPPRDLTPPPGAAPEWLFLHDHPGYSPAPLTPPPPSSRPNVGPIAPSLVPRDGYVFPERLPRPQAPPILVPWLMPQPGPAPGAGQPLPVPRRIESGP
jgi:hypothetical protein